MRAFCLLFALTALFSLALAGNDDNSVQFNTQDEESEINSYNVQYLTIKHNLTTCGSVTGKPVDIGNDKMCVTDFGGCISCWNYRTGQRLWLVNITQYGFPNGYYARVGMAYDDGVLYAATASYKNLLTNGLPGVGAWAFAIQSSNGALKWKTQIATESWAIVTQDPILYDNSVYYGVSSGEAAAPLTPGYQCCEFIGSTVSLKQNNGQIQWNSPNIPDDLAGVGKYSGAASWGGRPVIIGAHIYQVSGQLYQVPQASADCTNANALNASCVDERVMFNAVIKRKRSDGRIIAWFRASAADTWNIACYFGGTIPGCQTFSSAFDYDITNLMYAKKSRQLIASSKSGFVWFLDLDLEVLGYHAVTGGSAAGGYVWRGAVRDDKDDEDVRAFFPNSNNALRNITLPNGQNTTNGAWVAYDGLHNVRWITPSPNGDRVYGSVGITNDIVYGSTRYQGLLVFMRQSTGQIIKTIQTAGAMIGTPTAIGNYILWGGGPGNALAGGVVDQKYVMVLALPGC